MSLTIHDRDPTDEVFPVSPVSPRSPIPERKSIPDAATEQRQYSEMMELQNAVGGIWEGPFPEAEPPVPEEHLRVSLSEPKVTTTKVTAVKGKPTTEKEKEVEKRLAWLKATHSIRPEELRSQLKDKNGKPRYN